MGSMEAALATCRARGSAMSTRPARSRRWRYSARRRSLTDEVALGSVAGWYWNRSPTAPTFVTLNDQLNRAHRRIRELKSREIELLAQNRTLWAAITELTDEDARSPAELCTSPLTARWSSDVRFGVGEHMRPTTKVPEPNST